jgi:hypothetical protein
LRGEFLQTSPKKQLKYFQKAIDKYIQLLVRRYRWERGTSNEGYFQDDKEISEQVQIEGQLFENLLTKKEQRMYFESLDPPRKPPK